MLLILAGLFSLLLSRKWLVCALYAYIEKDIPSFLFFIVLSIIAFSIGLALIKCGLNITLKQYLTLTCSPPAEPTNDSGSNGNVNGSGNGNGNGNGNGGTNHDGIGGGHRSDEDKETYNERKLEYLESQETKYELSLRKANAKLSFFRNKKTRLAKKGQKDETIDHEMSLYKDIQNGSRFRLIVARN